MTTMFYENTIYGIACSASTYHHCVQGVASVWRLFVVLLCLLLIRNFDYDTLNGVTKRCLHTTTVYKV